MTFRASLHAVFAMRICLILTFYEAVTVTVQAGILWGKKRVNSCSYTRIPARKTEIGFLSTADRGKSIPYFVVMDP
jgi:hypothetical protein